MPDRIEVEGLNELRRTLKALGDSEGAKEIKAAGKKVAAEIVIPAAKGNASTKLEQRAADTLKAAAVSTGGGLRFGGGFAAAFGAEFGAAQGQLRNTRRGTWRGWNQFKPWRGSGLDAGYFLWPAIRDKTPEIKAEYMDALQKIFERTQ